MELFSILTIVGRSISLPFLFLTYLHYWHTNKFRYLYRMCFMNYLIHLMISNIWSIWAVSNGYQNKRPKYILHIFNFIELSLLLWTNVLCFNFWRNIRNLIPYSDSKKERITYIKCLIYVWSCDLLYTTVGVINDFLLRDKRTNAYEAVRWLMFLFQIILLLINASMIIHATVLIIKEMKIIKNLKGPDTMKNKEKHKKKLILYGKLFVVTIFLLCSKWLWSSLDNMLNDPRVHEIFNYFMVGNAFQGIFIFLLFTLKKKKIKTLKTKVSGLFTEPNTQESFLNKEMITVNTKVESK